MFRASVIFCTLAALLFSGANINVRAEGAADGPVLTGAQVEKAVQHDTSPPLDTLRSLGAKAPSAPDRPLRLIPPHGASGAHPDTVLQTSAPTPAVATSTGLNFDGVGIGFTGPAGSFTPNAAPPDTEGAVGLTQYVQWVNESFAVFDKLTGTALYGPVTGNTLWTGFGGQCETSNDGDPVVLYDHIANRWIFTQFSVPTNGPYYQCVAVSTTADAMGSYNRYAFQEPNFNDYPKLGIWPDGYYLSFNMFNGNSFAGPRVCSLDRAAMLAGNNATQQCFDLSTSYGGLLPSDLDGSTPPPTGSPNYFVSFDTNSLDVWKFHVDWATPTNTTLTGPAVVATAPFSAACSGGGACIPQPNTSQRLDSLADRLMYRLAYRNFGDHESLVVTHSVSATVNGAATVGVRWYELRISSGAASMFQQGTYAPDANYRWMGSIAMDKLGDIALGYSVSSSTVYPGIRYTGRVPSDPLGTMEAETDLLDGGGSQGTAGHKLARWGDYSTMSVDPVDDCTFWYTTEYLKSSGTFNWSTRVASFRFPSCPAVVPPATSTPTATATGSSTATPTPTSTPTNTHTATPTNVPPTSSPTPTRAPTNTPTVTNTATSTPTKTPTVTNTATSTATNVPTATNTPTSTATNVPTVTNTPTSAATKVPTVTNTPTSTATAVPTATSTAPTPPTQTPTATNAATPTSTPTSTPGIEVSTASSTLQYTLTGSDGTSWLNLDSNALALSLTPTTTVNAILSANADLWTSSAGYNQDLGIWVSGGTFGSGQVVGWKESGGPAAFSPNAAYLQAVVPLSGGTTYSVKLVWKANRADPSTIWSGAGSGSPYSPTGLTAELIPVATTVSSGVSSQQYTLTGSDGSSWMDMDASKLLLTLTPTTNSTAILSGNADLWTSSAGYNQDMGIWISGGSYGSGQLVAWKESGGPAANSPDAAYVQVPVRLIGGTTYSVKLVWKSNKADPSTIWAGAGPIGGAFSPTRLTAEVVPSGSTTTVTDALSTQQYLLSGSDGSTWTSVDASKLLLTLSPAVNSTVDLSANADLWTGSAGYNQDIGIWVSGGTFGSGRVVTWGESGGSATNSPNAAYVHTLVNLIGGTTYSVKLQWKANTSDPDTIWAGAGPIGADFSPTRLTAVSMVTGP